MQCGEVQPILQTIYHRTGFNCVVKSFRFRVLKVNYVFNNCVIAYAYRSMRNAFQFLCVERKLTIRNY